MDYGAAPAASAGTFITGFLSLQNGSSLEQKIARAGIDTDSIRYIVQKKNRKLPELGGFRLDGI